MSSAGGDCLKAESSLVSTVVVVGEVAAVAAAGTETIEGLSTLTFFGEGVPEGERDRLVVVGWIADGGPIRGEAGGKWTREELSGSVVSGLMPGEGDRARNGGATSEQSVSGVGRLDHSD